MSIERDIVPVESLRGTPDADIDQVEFQETVAALRRGLEDMSAGRTRPADAVFADLDAKHGIRANRPTK